MQIVKFYKAIYPKFWSSNQLVDIKFKGNLHVIKFQNPTHISVGCLNVDDSGVLVLNNFNWILLSDNSPLVGRLENYVRGKYTVSSIMFIQYLDSKNGTHFEIAYLDDKQKFQTAYVLYIPATDVFTDDNTEVFTPKTFGNDSYINPLPKDLEGSIKSFCAKEDLNLDAVISYVTLGPRTFAVIGISDGKRWQYIINWSNEAWTLVSKQPYVDGFYASKGVPSASAASCTGFLKRLYPQAFVGAFVYVSIETKSVGINLFTRIVVKIGVSAYEGVVSTTFGVQSSHVVQKWAPILFVKPKEDFGYGKDQKIDYGVNKELLYIQSSKPASLTVETPQPAEPVTPPAKTACGEGTRSYFGDVCLPVF